MKALAGKSAVVTGAASGIGYALAERLAREKMSVVIADIEQYALDDAVTRLRGQGATVLPVRVDVSDFGSVRSLARAAFDAFGVPHVVCSNAGVGGTVGAMESVALDDWQWTINVNLYGAIHCLKAFLGPMKQRDDDGHFVFTASTAGLLCSTPEMLYAAGPLVASKYGLVGLAEATYYQLEATRVGVSCLCPIFSDTKILSSDRNRPGGPRQAATDPRVKALFDRAEEVLKQSLSPVAIAERTLEAILERRFWILPDPRVLDSIKSRAQAIAGEGPVPARHSLDEPG